MRIPLATIAANELVDVALAANNWHGDRQTRPEAEESFAERKEEVVSAAERNSTATAEALDAVRTGVVRLLELE